MKKPSTSTERNAPAAPALESSFGPVTVQPKGFTRGTVDTIGCMAGDWDVTPCRTTSTSLGESAAHTEKTKRERY